MSAHDWSKRPGPVVQGLLVTFALILGIVTRLPDRAIQLNLAFVQLNDAISTRAESQESRVAKVNAAKTVLDKSAPLVSSPRFTDQLSTSIESVTLEDLLTIGDRLFFRLDEPEVARQWYAFATTRHPQSSAAYYKLAEVEAHMLQIEESENHYLASIRLDHLPELGVGSSDPYCRLGGLQREHEAIRDLRKAQENLEMGLRLNQFGSREIESYCYYELGNTRRWQNAVAKEYIELYQKAVTSDESNALAYLMLGVATFESSGDLEESERYLRQSIRARPSVRAYQELGRIHEAVGNYDLALGYYRDALAVAETNRSIPEIEAAIQRLENETGSP